MLVILPPSETKSDGGTLGPLELDSLWLPQLTAVRDKLITELIELSGDAEAARVALGLGKARAGNAEGLQTALARNAALRTAATTPALERYTGVLYDALDAGSLTKAQRARAQTRLAIGSALFGVVRAGDAIPGYRLSGGSKLPGMPTLAALWKPVLAPALREATAGDLVVDLRSGSYQQLGRLPGAVTATVLTERPDGSRTVVSHFNKHHKGLLARALVSTRAEPSDIRALARIAEKAGLRVEIASSSELLVLT